jgi:hypothetical protein
MSGLDRFLERRLENRTALILRCKIRAMRNSTRAQEAAAHAAAVRHHLEWSRAMHDAADLFVRIGGYTCEQKRR